MIQPGTYQLTQTPRTMVSCDAPGCTENYWLPEGLGPYHGANKMTQLGWQITVLPNCNNYPAYCPVHATDQQTCQHEWKNHQRLDNGVVICGRCGRARTETDR